MRPDMWIKKKIKDYVKTQIREVILEPEAAIDYDIYKVAVTKKPEMKDLMFTEDVINFSIKIAYLDENMRKRDYEFKISGLQGLNQVTAGDYSLYLQSDVCVIREINLWMRYKYKDQEESELHVFGGYANNYKPEVLGRVFSEIQEWLRLKPEYLI